MSLKAFHIVFIIFSTLLALGTGVWCLWVNLVEGAPIYVAGAVASFVAAGPADVADVGTAFTTGAAAGPATRAALGVAHEPLLLVVLLIGRRVDEFHAAIHAVEASIDVGHVAPPTRAALQGCALRAAASADGTA